MKLTKKQLVTGGLVIGGMVLIFFLAYKVLPNVMVLWTKAAPATRVSITDSYILGEKILAKADGEDACRVNVFLMDKSGKPVSNQAVELEGISDIEKVNDMSNNTGKVTFEVRSSEEGQFKLSAVYNGVPIGEPLTVTFRNVK